WLWQRCTFETTEKRVAYVADAIDMRRRRTPQLTNGRLAVCRQSDFGHGSDLRRGNLMQNRVAANFLFTARTRLEDRLLRKGPEVRANVDVAIRRDLDSQNSDHVLDRVDKEVGSPCPA